MSLRSIVCAVAVAAALAVSSTAFASVLIVNGASATSEPGTTSSITTNLNALLIAAGNTTVISDGVPGDLSPYSQIWDIRFSNSLPITLGQQTQFLNFLQAGGGMFVMGENAGFTTRNNSVLALIQVAGGGTLSFTTPSSTQTVLAPFTGPNTVSSITYLAPGGVGLNAPGTGQFITVDLSNRGTGLAFGVGTLTNAPAGALTTIFDVNFMQTNASADSQNLLKNLITFVEEEVNPPGVIPEPASALVWAALVAGLCVIYGYHANKPASHVQMLAAANPQAGGDGVRS